ncbi:MAG: DUF4124 domain-containing protein [Deltaproteobacteria bacterium]|nr:DUF4124 domain-containing protein [Deltaproteobacteria bacterium]
MKLFKTALITFGLLVCCATGGYADRIYTWKDSKGVTHITQEPPPQTAKSIDIMDYSAQPEPTIPRQPASESLNPQQGNQDQGGGQAGSSPGAGIASGDADDNIVYDYTGGPYRQTLRRYERRGERLDDNVPIREGGIMQPRPRGR